MLEDPRCTGALLPVLLDKDPAGIDYDLYTRKPRWVRVQGASDTGGQAGVLLMSHPDNHGHPEKLRTWDKQHGGAVFVNFNTVMEEPWIFAPGNTYARNYRLFVYDGAITPEEADHLWKDYGEMAHHEQTAAP